MLRCQTEEHLDSDTVVVYYLRNMYKDMLGISFYYYKAFNVTGYYGLNCVLLKNMLRVLTPNTSECGNRVAANVIS